MTSGSGRVLQSVVAPVSGYFTSGATVRRAFLRRTAGRGSPKRPAGDDGLFLFGGAGGEAMSAQSWKDLNGPTPSPCRRTRT